jgi:hypothetical protein
MLASSLIGSDIYSSTYAYLQVGMFTSGHMVSHYERLYSKLS